MIKFLLKLFFIVLIPYLIVFYTNNNDIDIIVGLWYFGWIIYLISEIVCVMSDIIFSITHDINVD